MDRIIRGVTKYSASHMYEIHALIAATLAFLLMFLIKHPIKNFVNDYVEKKALQNEKWMKNKVVYRKRMNMLVIVTTTVVTWVIFGLVSVVSPLIDYSWKTAGLSVAFALSEYAVFEQFYFGWRERDE